MRCDHQRWAPAPKHDERQPEESLGLFEALRRVTVDSLAACQDLQRLGHHDEAGAAPIARLVAARAVGA